MARSTGTAAADLAATRLTRRPCAISRTPSHVTAPCHGAATSIVQEPDPLLLGTTAPVIGNAADILGKTLRRRRGMCGSEPQCRAP